MALNVTTAVIGSGCNAATASPSLVQWDKGQILQISGVELPETYKVEFSNADTLEAIPAIGTAEGVEIPDKLLYSSSPIRAYIVLSEAEGERNTEYWVTIYVKPREIPEDIEPTPAQQDVIDDLIAQLNTGVGKAEAAADAAEASAGEAETASQAVQDLGVRAETAASGAPAAVQKIVDAETGAVTLVFSLPQGEAGVSPVVTVTTITGGHRVTVTDDSGAHTFDVMDGRSVTGVTMGADYKLTFTFSDGTTWTTPTSIRGETGATPRLTIGTVSTLDPGQGATAEITGTPEDPVLNLGIPKGQAGASDAGGVTYDPTETYQSGTAGAALNDLSRQLSDLEDTVSTTQIINTASGEIASFSDGADNRPIRKLVAQIEPVQDLNGYDSPWPAGGGKNLLDPSKRTAYSDGKGQRWYEADGFTLKANQAYTFSVTYANLIALYIRSKSDGTALATGNQSVTYTPPEDMVVYFQAYRGESISSVDTFQLELGSTASSFAPYENICPISGWTGAEVEQRGVNVWDEEWETGIYSNDTGAPVVNANRIRSKNHIQVKPSTTYYLYCGNSSIGIVVHYFKADGTQISQAPVKNATFTTPANTAYILFNTSTADLSTYNHDISINYPSTATAYAPYTDNQISVNFPSEAGTVYGGHITINPDRTGTLVVDRAIVDLGTMAWGYQSSPPQFYSNGIAETSINWSGWDDTPPLICSRYKPIPNALLASSDFCIGYAYNSKQLRVNDSGFTDAESFKTAMSGVQLVYKLATPITYQLTESEVSGILETLYGTNNIWSSTGDTEVTYPADTKLYIDGKITQAIANALNS